MAKVLPLQTRVVRNARRRGLKVYTRRQWGTQHSSVYWRRLVTHPVKRREADTLWQHISVTRDDGATKLDFFADMRELERIGWERFKTGVSYNFAIDMETGEVGVGQHLLAKGSHTLNNKGIPNYSFDQNAVARAIVFIGMPGQKPSKKAIRAAGHLFAAMMEERALTATPDYNPHRLVAAKACPTDAVVAAMPAIRSFAFSVCKRPRR